MSRRQAIVVATFLALASTHIFAADAAPMRSRRRAAPKR